MSTENFYKLTKENIKDEYFNFHYGLNFGIETFLFSSFFIDIHCRKSLRRIAKDNYDDLTPLKLVLGVGYQF